MFIGQVTYPFDNYVINFEQEAKNARFYDLDQ